MCKLSEEMERVATSLKTMASISEGDLREFYMALFEAAHNTLYRHPDNCAECFKKRVQSVTAQQKARAAGQ